MLLIRILLSILVFQFSGSLLADSTQPFKVSGKPIDTISVDNTPVKFFKTKSVKHRVFKYKVQTPANLFIQNLSKEFDYVSSISKSPYDVFTIIEKMELQKNSIIFQIGTMKPKQGTQLTRFTQDNFKAGTYLIVIFESDKLLSKGDQAIKEWTKKKNISLKGPMIYKDTKYQDKYYPSIITRIQQP